MEKYFFDLKCGASGWLDDGRFYNVMSIPSITMGSDGTFKYGDIKVGINNEPYVMRIDEFISHIKTIGNLTIK